MHRSSDFGSQPMRLILNLPMEGSSGEPGPTADTHYRARDVYAGRTREW